MERWRGLVAVVTGAGGGIGSAIAYQLLDSGIDVVALVHKMNNVAEAVERARYGAASRGRVVVNKAPCLGKLHCIKCDITKENDVLSAFSWVQVNTGGLHILVNNAGVMRITNLTDTKTKYWRHLFDVNVLGLSMCTREAVKQMRANGVDNGHIVHISSIAGHKTHPLHGFEMYAATKHSVKLLTEGLRKELMLAKSKIRVTEVSPGLVLTGIFDLSNVDQDEVYERPHLFPEDIAEAVLYALSAPLHVQIHSIVVKPLGEPG